MDMWKPFRNVTKDKAPQAAILFDKFHVMRHLGEALDKVRKAEYAHVSGKNRRFIKGQKYNLLWGAPRIPGELFKLRNGCRPDHRGEVHREKTRPPSQGWGTFVHNHADAIASIDMFMVPTISFGPLYGLVILRQSRRELLWLGVRAHPNAGSLARQLTEACGWDEPPRYLIRDRDGAYGAACIRRIRAMGIRDRPVSALIGSMRWECLDHVVVAGERHLRHVLASHQNPTTR
jgi:Transposase